MLHAGIGDPARQDIRVRIPGSPPVISPPRPIGRISETTESGQSKYGFSPIRLRSASGSSGIERRRVTLFQRHDCLGVRTTLEQYWVPSASVHHSRVL